MNTAFVIEAILTSPLGVVTVRLGEDGALKTSITAELEADTSADDAIRVADRLAEAVRRLGGGAAVATPSAPSPFGTWLMERTERDPAARTLSRDLHRDYVAWCDIQPVRPMSIRAFGDALRERQIFMAGKDASGFKFRGGVRLRAAPSLPLAAPPPAPPSPDRRTQGPFPPGSPEAASQDDGGSERPPLQ